MPNWSDDEGRCYYKVDGLPCYQSNIGCPMHRSEKSKRKTKVRLSAYEQCRNALSMTEPGHYVAVPAEVLEALLKHYDELRLALLEAKSALNSVKGVDP